MHTTPTRRRCLSLVAACLAGLSGCATSFHTAHAQRSLPVIIDPTETHQTITGWGASGVWYGQVVGQWPQAQRDQILDLLYGPDGARLTIYRYI